MTAQRKFLNDQGMHYYVPGMQAGADLGQLLRQRVSLGAPAVADADGILAAADIGTTAVDTTTFASTYAATNAIMGPFGRIVTVVASGTATSAVVVYGRDYLNQKIRENFTLNGATPVTGKKAFKYIDRVTAAVTASRTINVGFGSGFGLPYKTVAVEREYVDNVVASAGTLTAPIFTDPQTTTTGDPRGTYVPTTTPDSAKVIELDAQFSNYVNASGNGGLHGIKHVAA